MGVDFLKEHTYEQIHDMFQELKNKADKAERELNKLRLVNVSQQRELLKKWWKYFDEESVAVNCNDEERDEVITNFFNCG